MRLLGRAGRFGIPALVLFWVWQAGCGLLAASSAGGEDGGNAGAAGAASTCTNGSAVYPDRDHDGRGVPYGTDETPVTSCDVAAEVRDDYAPNDIDCDDTNPNVFLLYGPDEDGDGVGRRDPDLVVCGGEDPPEGYARTGETGDCNDEDADIHPEAVELFSDGVDSNCDGADAPACRFDLDEALTDVPTIPPDCPDQPDVTAYALFDCEMAGSCFAPYYLMLENIGGAVYDGPVTLRVFVGGYDPDPTTQWLEFEELRTDLSISLDPGERSMPVLVGFPNSVGGQYVEVEIDLGGFVDCDPGNNITPEVFLIGYECGWYQ